MTIIHLQDSSFFVDTSEKTIMIEHICQLNSHYHRLFIILGGRYFVKCDLFSTTFIEYLSLLQKNFDSYIIFAKIASETVCIARTNNHIPLSHESTGSFSRLGWRFTVLHLHFFLLNKNICLICIKLYTRLQKFQVILVSINTLVLKEKC